ncbi:transposase [Streptomyces sp. NPDC056255]|uniref:transposase n=1 Tax=Streptomyces sp. NPDC056255 TaxID=3345764 RepID=UPI0035E2434B
MQWARVEPLLPDRTPRRGGRWRDHREVIDAIAWKFRTGSQWIHLPEKYGNRRGVCNRLRVWALDGTWERGFTALVAQADADDDLNWAVSVGSTIVRAHQHAAGAARRGSSRRTGMGHFKDDRGGEMWRSTVAERGGTTEVEPEPRIDSVRGAAGSGFTSSGRGLCSITAWQPVRWSQPQWR